MSKSRVEGGDQLTAEKIMAHKKFFKASRLDVERNGNGIALLVDELAERNPEGWQEDIDQIIRNTQRIEKEQSLQAAMLYLGDMIEKINIQRLTALYGPGRELTDLLRFIKTIGQFARKTLDPYSRIIPSEADNAVSPHWWDQLENQYVGKFDEYLSQIDEAKGSIAGKVGKVIG